MVWTEITRAKYRRDEQRYSSDQTDAEWKNIAPHLPKPNRLGRPRKRGLRSVVDGILYIATTGGQWRLLPKDFPTYTTVQGYFYDWRDSGVWQTVNHHLVMATRELMGREASPTAGHSRLFGEACRLDRAFVRATGRVRFYGAVEGVLRRAEPGNSRLYRASGWEGEFAGGADFRAVKYLCFR